MVRVCVFCTVIGYRIDPITLVQNAVAPGRGTLLFRCVVGLCTEVILVGRVEIDMRLCIGSKWVDVVVHRNEELVCAVNLANRLLLDFLTNL
jgi:hypothetical protein